MKPLDAAYHVVHDYPGGAVALAPRLGKLPTTLCHEVKQPAGSAAKLGLVDAVKITDLADDDRILHAFAEHRGLRCVSCDTPERDSAKDLMASFATFCKEVGEAMTAAAQAIADGRITENEIHEFEKQVGDIAPAAVSLAERMRILGAQKAKLRAVGGTST